MLLVFGGSFWSWTFHHVSRSQFGDGQRVPQCASNSFSPGSLESLGEFPKLSIIGESGSGDLGIGTVTRTVSGLVPGQCLRLLEPVE